MLLGKELEEAIKEMGLNPSSFAKLCKRPNGTHLSQSAIVGLIRTSGIKPEDETKELVEAVLRKRCRCCDQFTEKRHAWNNQTAEPGKGAGNRKA